MKKFIIFGIVAMSVSTAAFAGDLCRSKALDAAETEYGNDPVSTKVKLIESGSEYHVAVGLGNPEDGEHYYAVFFPDGCKSTPSVTEISKF